MSRKGFKVTPSIRKKINALAKRVGCPLNWRRACGIQWNGIDVACKNQDASNIIHDIAHYTMATKQARKSPDFGLGFGPDSIYDLTVESKSIYRRSKCDAIERRASALGIHWEKELGLNWESTAEYHAWTSRYGRDFGGEMSELKKVWRSLSHTIKKYKGK
jgi:hypothetical protein